MLNLRASSEQSVQLCLMQLSRKTDDRFRDITESLRNRVIRELEHSEVRPSWIALIRERGQLEAEAASLIMGESLPTGLRIL